MKDNSIPNVIVRLTLARQKLDEVLRLTALAAVIPTAARNEISVMGDDLDRIIAGLEKVLDGACVPFHSDLTM